MKIKKITSFLLCTVLLSGLLSCKDKNGPLSGNCDELSNDYQAKVSAFSTTTNKATCTAMISSLTNFVNKCSLLSASQKQAYNETLAEADCSVYP